MNNKINGAVLASWPTTTTPMINIKWCSYTADVKVCVLARGLEKSGTKQQKICHLCMQKIYVLCLLAAPFPQCIQKGKQEDNFVDSVNTYFFTQQTFLAWVVISCCNCLAYYDIFQPFERKKSKNVLMKMSSCWHTVLQELLENGFSPWWIEWEGATRKIFFFFFFWHLICCEKDL